jgi:putative ABC transport system substrate-binding protein
MRRREFISLLGGAAVSWPVGARAQQGAMPVIGFMSGRSPADSAYLVDAFRQGLRETGYLEGETISVEYRWADGDYDRLPGFASDLLGTGGRVGSQIPVLGWCSVTSRPSPLPTLLLVCIRQSPI